MQTTTANDDTALLDSLESWLKAGGEITINATAYGSQSVGVSLNKVRTNFPTFREALTAAFVEHTRLRMLGDKTVAPVEPPPSINLRPFDKHNLARGSWE